MDTHLGGEAFKYWIIHIHIARISIVHLRRQEKRESG